MPGAYTAKPIVTTPPDVPDGWDVDWDFPGAHPPGYEPEYSLGVTASGTVIPGSAAAGAAKLYDHATYATNEPEDSSLTWTATLDGDQLDLKLEGGDSFLASITTGYGDVGDDFWGAGVTFEFDITDGDIGKTIELKSAGIVFEDHSVVSTADIEIVGVKTAKFTVVITPPEFPPPAPPWTQYMHDVTIRFFEETGVTFEPWARLRAYRSQHYYAPEWYYDEGASPIDEIGVWVPVDDGGSWILGTTSEGTVIIEALELESGVTYHVTHYYYALNTTTTYDLTLEVFEGETVIYSKTKQMIVSATDTRTVWCTIDGTTGEITEVNP